MNRGPGGRVVTPGTAAACPWDACSGPSDTTHVTAWGTAFRASGLRGKQPEALTLSVCPRHECISGRKVTFNNVAAPFQTSLCLYIPRTTTTMRSLENGVLTQTIELIGTTDHFC